MKGNDLSFTIPKPYLIGGLSKILIIFYHIYPITNTLHYLLWLIRYSKYFGNLFVSKLLFVSFCLLLLFKFVTRVYGCTQLCKCDVVGLIITPWDYMLVICTHSWFCKEPIAYRMI